MYKSAARAARSRQPFAFWQSKGSQSRTVRSARSGGSVLRQSTSCRITITVACAPRAILLAAHRVRNSSARFMPSSAHFVRSQYMKRACGHVPSEKFCSACTDARGAQCASIAPASSRFQLCTKTSTVPTARQGCTTCFKMLSAQ